MLPDAAGTERDALAVLTHRDFLTRVGEDVRIFKDTQAIDASLVEVTAAQRGMRANGDVPFRLLYRGPARPVLEQAIHRVVHSDGCALDMFLVPVGPLDGGMAYEAVFG
jgi:uncharacterized protein DUF6916